MTDAAPPSATRVPLVERRSSAPEAGARPSVAYELSGSAVFGPALRGAALMVPTLGLHRFWMITRLRRLIWGAVRIDGEPLEYAGRPLELFFGFLAAVVALAVVLGLANLALLFAGLVGEWNLTLAFNASLPLLAPLGYYARYRARRYLAARTRWRGIRFGMAPGAGAYSLHATGHLVLTILSLGMLYPRMQVMLAARRQSATWYGDHRFVQSARWRALMKVWLAAWALPLLVLVLAMGQVFKLIYVVFPEHDLVLRQEFDPAMAEPFLNAALSVGGTVALAALISWPLRRRYDAAVERALMDGLALGSLRFASTLRTGALLLVDVKTVALYAAAVGFGAVMAWALIVSVALSVRGVDLSAFGGLASALAAVAGYALVIIPFIAARWVTAVHWPLQARLDALTLTGLDGLSDIRQRQDDAARESGGLADALDVGAGF